jgi:hypothetical protein
MCASPLIRRLDRERHLLGDRRRAPAARPHLTGQAPAGLREGRDRGLGRVEERSLTGSLRRTVIVAAVVRVVLVAAVAAGGRRDGTGGAHQTQ